MAANTAIIGRVAIKVMPDTHDFRRDAERDINRIEAQLPPLTVHTDIDFSGASRGALEELRKINARNRQTDSRKIRFHAIISTDGMTEAISRAVRQLNERAAQRKIKIEADLVAAVAALELDPESLKQVQADLKKWVGETSPLKIDVVTTMGVAATTAVSARLKVLTRPRTVSILPKVNNAALAGAVATLAALSGLRLGQSLFDSLWGVVKGLDKVLPKVAALGEGLVGLAGAALTSTSNLLALGSSIASLGGLLIPLPVLVGSLIVSFVTLRVAFQGFGDAVSKGGESLAKLPPRMRAAAEAIRGFKIAKGPIQEAFWKDLAASIIAVREKAFPSFLKGLTGTAKSLNGFARALLDAIAAVKPKVFDSIFAGFNKSIDIAAKGMKPLVGVFATLGMVGATYLPRLAQWFVDLTTRFDEFLTRASGDGTLQLWLENAIQAAKDLGGVVKGLYGIFHGLGKAAEAAGGSTLGVLSKSLQGLSDTINSEGVQERLTAIFKAAHDGFALLSSTAGPGLSAMFKSLTPVLEKLLVLVGGTVGTVLNAIGRALAQPVVANGLLDLFTGIDAAVKTLAPALFPLGTALGLVATLIGDMAKHFAPSFATAFEAIGAVVEELVPKIQEALPGFTNLLNQAMKPLVPIVTLLAGVLGTLVSVLGSVAEVMGPLVPILVSAFAAWYGLTKVIQFAKFIILMWQIVAVNSAVALSLAGSAAKSAAAWVASTAQMIAANARVVASMILVQLKSVASMAITVATVVAGWVVMGVQAMLGAAKMAAAWLIALGPIGILIAAVVAIGIAIYKNWDLIKQGAAALWEGIRPIFRFIINAYLSLVGALISGAAKAFGWVPGIGGKLKAAAAQFNEFRDDVNRSLGGIKDKKIKIDVVETRTASRTETAFLAHGGYVPSRPGGIDAVIGEGVHNELVLPLPKGLKPQHLAAVLNDLADGPARSGDGKTLNYYAAENKSLSSEEELFEAAERARMVGW